MPVAGREKVHESRRFAKTALRLVPDERGEIFGDARYKMPEAEFLSLHEIAKRRSGANANLISFPKEGVVDACKTIARTAGYADKVGDSCLRMRIRHCLESAKRQKVPGVLRGVSELRGGRATREGARSGIRVRQILPG